MNMSGLSLMPGVELGYLEDVLDIYIRHIEFAIMDGKVMNQFRKILASDMRKTWKELSARYSYHAYRGVDVSIKGGNSASNFPAKEACYVVNTRKSPEERQQIDLHYFWECTDYERIGQAPCNRNGSCCQSRQIEPYVRTPDRLGHHGGATEGVCLYQ